MCRIKFGLSETQKLAHRQTLWREAAITQDHVSSQGLGQFSYLFSARGVGFSPSRVGVHYLKEILTGPKGLDIIKVHFQMFKGQCPNGQHAWVGSSSLAGVLGTSHTARTDLNTQGWELRNEIVAAQKASPRTFSETSFLMMLFYQLDFCITGDKESLVWELPAALLFFYSSFIYSPLIFFLGISRGWRQFWFHKDRKARLGAHCGAPLGRHLLRSLVSH